MRVVWIYKSPWKKPGPIVYMGVLNALACARREVDTDLFVSANGHSSPDTANPECDIEGDLRAFYGVSPAPRLRIHRISGRHRPGKNFLRLKRPVYRAALLHLEWLLAAGEKVLVVTRELGVLPALLRLRRRYPGLRIFHEAHDFYGSIRHLPVRRLSDYRRWISERFYLPRVAGLVCITEPQRKLYQQVFPRLPTLLLPLGCLEPRKGEDPENRRRARCIGYVGHLHGGKGYDLLLEAAHQLRPHNVRIQCYGGYPSEVQRLRNNIAAAGLTGAIQLEPFQAPSKMLSWLAEEVSLGVAPLQDTFYNRHLTCPVKVLDSLSQGLPVVGSDLPSVRDLAGPAAEYHAPGDVTAFVSAVLRPLNDPARYHTLARESVARAQTLSWPNRAGSLLKFASELPS